MNGDCLRVRCRSILRNRGSGRGLVAGGKRVLKDRLISRNRENGSLILAVSVSLRGTIRGVLRRRV